jgi:hypothetical protein
LGATEAVAPVGLEFVELTELHPVNTAHMNNSEIIFIAANKIAR